MQELALLSVTLLFMSLGLLSPFVLSLGYVWVDTLLPHRLSYSILSSLQIAFIMGASAVGVFLLKDRRSPPRITTLHVLCLLMAIWITLTSTWAVSPVNAWGKWDTSFKTVVFVLFMPFVFRTRIQIEAFVMIFAFSAAGHLLPWGIKTLLTGGGYQLSLGLMGVNSTLLAESSTVAAVTVMFIPMLLWMKAHSLIVPWPKVRLWGASGMTVIYIIANIGTFARTGLIAFGVVGAAMLLKTKRKFLFILIAALLGGVAFYFMSDRWTARISTISEYQTEGSALVRLLVWKWTIDFATSHPFGGGFNSYVINVLPVGMGANGQMDYQYGRAFHNIYFAALGEHGYPGLALYIAILVLSLVTMQRTISKAKPHPDLAWAADLCRALQIGLLVLMACGNFVDISFSFLVWNLIALTLCINAHVAQVLNPRLVKAELPARLAIAISRPAGGSVAASPRLR